MAGKDSKINGRLLLIFLGLAPIIYAVARGNFGLHSLPGFCPFRQIAGLPCPFCGGTTTWILIFKGRILEGIGTNPLSASLLLADFLAIIYLTLSLFISRIPIPNFESSLPLKFWWAIIGIIAANWVYLLVRVIVAA